MRKKQYHDNLTNLKGGDAKPHHALHDLTNDYVREIRANVDKTCQVQKRALELWLHEGKNSSHACQLLRFKMGKRTFP